MGGMRGAKGIIDVDGSKNSWSGLWWKLRSSSVVLKVEPQYKQWYYSRMFPWQHYVPITANLSNLWQNIDYVLDPSHDQDIHNIARNATAFVRSMTMERETLELQRQLDAFFRS